jgi:hypothetical protein
MVGVVSLGQVGITVSDLPRMLDFYTRVLGLTITDGGARGAFLSAQPEAEHHEFVIGLNPDRRTNAPMISFASIPWATCATYTMGFCVSPTAARYVALITAFHWRAPSPIRKRTRLSCSGPPVWIIRSRTRNLSIWTFRTTNCLRVCRHCRQSRVRWGASTVRMWASGSPPRQCPPADVRLDNKSLFVREAVLARGPGPSSMFQSFEPLRARNAARASAHVREVKSLSSKETRTRTVLKEKQN